MNKHDHKHSCVCEHDKVKYCKRCCVVHCLDCGREWQDRTYTWTYPWSYTVGNTWQGNAQNVPVTTSGQISLDSNTSCKHQ